MPTELILLPPPQKLQLHDGFYRPLGRSIFVDEKNAEALQRTALIVQETLSAAGLRFELASAADCAVSIRIDAQTLKTSECYRLSVTPRTIEIMASDAVGAFYAAMTLRQLFRLLPAGGALQCVQIEDWPNYSQRGVMLDISRDKVPAMHTFFKLADMFAEWKINQLQLYTEHTFAYQKHMDVWRDASPLTAAEIEELDRYCRERHIELVPNQNSFGHMERWLKHPQYIHLAEAPNGFTDPWGNARGAYGLCPLEPQAIEFIAGLYDELLPHFTSRQFNAGCDETFDLGLGKSKQACAERGAGRVYLEFLLKIYELSRKHGRTLQFWGDIVLNHSELISELPPDSIALNWGYEANHPFGEQCEKFALARVPFYVCPGTSSWNSIAGRTDNAVANINLAARAGRQCGAAGLLNTDWGDNGHWQHLPVSYLGFACGAAAAWNVEAAGKLDLPAALNIHAFGDSAGVMGKLAADLGNAYAQTGVTVMNNSILALILQRPEAPAAQVQAMGLTIEGLQRTLKWIDDVMARMPGARMNPSDGSLICSEFENTAELLRVACKLVIARLENPACTTSGLPQKTCADLSRSLRDCMEAYRSLWIQRNRTGGLNDSIGRMQKLLELLHS